MSLESPPVSKEGRGGAGGGGVKGNHAVRNIPHDPRISHPSHRKLVVQTPGGGVTMEGIPSRKALTPSRRAHGSGPPTPGTPRR